SGGQVGDRGFVRTETGLAEVRDTRKAAGVYIHVAEVTEGHIEAGQPAKLEVAHGRRAAIRANHSATHLLHEALRRALGDHVAQKGSLNADDRLRFDFSHTKALTAAELAQVEAEVNDFVRQNTPVETRIMTPDDARALGAQALFGEKYGDEVRVVSMGHLTGSGKGADGATYSLELCGGTHVARTGDIGAFVLLGDSASAAGIRRIEALTGAAALGHLRAQEARLLEVAGLLKTPLGGVVDRVRALAEERKALANEVASLRREMATGGASSAAPETQDINGIKYLAQVLQGVSSKDMPALIDAAKGRIGSGAVLFIAETGGKAAVSAGVTADLTGRVSAVAMVKAAAEALGGKGGGGRPEMAHAGGASVDNAAGAIAAVAAVLRGE
ncbi:MAG: DHHA1 domain-containing protein, partial [Gemmobacter sp.]|nr:DHHA1 domain-containing protein [Gemmobacter sp.]